MDHPDTPDRWYATHTGWPAEVAALRAVVLAAGLSETLKWRQPAYQHNGRTIVIVGALKSAATLSFLRGALLDDPQGLLVQPGENSRHARYMAFRSVEEIVARRAWLDGFLRAAMAVADAGERVEPPAAALELVDELKERMRDDPEFAAAFSALTPGRQRGYNLHFGRARRAATRVARIEQCAARIRMGKGLHDCICGHSQRPPRCDGSHKKYQ